MPVIIVTGLPRSGKSYHAVKTEAVDAAKSGSRILTSIEGLNAGALSLLVGKHVELVRVTDDEWRDPLSYPFTEADGTILPGAIVQPGDVLLIDEFHAVWAASDRVGDKLDARIAQFFRFHGKYIGGPAKRSIRIILITHGSDDIHPFIRRIVDATIEVTNMRNLGFGKRYRTVEYARDKPLLAFKISGPSFHRLEPKYWNLYRSFSTDEAGVVKGTSSTRFRNALILCCLGFLLAFGFGIKGFSSLTTGGKSAPPSMPKMTIPTTTPTTSQPVSGTPQSAFEALVAPAAKDNRPMVYGSPAVQSVPAPPSIYPQYGAQEAQQGPLVASSPVSTQERSAPAPAPSQRVHGAIQMQRFGDLTAYGNGDRSRSTYVDPSSVVE